MTEADPLVDLLLRGAILSNGVGPLDVAIWHGQIKAIGEKLVLPATQEIDLNGSLVIPGFVNLHCHLDKAFTILEAGNETGTTREARESLRQAKRNFTKIDIKIRAERALKMAIRHGTTALRCHVDVDPLVGLRGMEALVELREEYANYIDMQLVAFPQEGFEQMPETEELIAAAMKMGADLVGGSPFDDVNKERHIDTVFRLAQEFGADIDIHADFLLTPPEERSGKAEDMITPYILRRIGEVDYEGQVTIGHFCRIDALPDPAAKQVITSLKNADVAVVAAPTSALYGQGRSDSDNVRRGLTRVKELFQAGVRVAYATDNTEDAFSPMGTLDMLHEAALLALVGHLTTLSELKSVIDMGTIRAAEIYGLCDYGTETGCRADLVVLDAGSVPEAIVRQAEKRYVLKSGRLIAENERREKLHSA